MKNKFIKTTYIVDGNEWDLIVNVNEIARLSYGFNQLEFYNSLSEWVKLCHCYSGRI